MGRGGWARIDFLFWTEWLETQNVEIEMKLKDETT